MDAPDKEWERLDALDARRDEPAKDSDALRKRLDELEYEAAKAWEAKRKEGGTLDLPPE